MITKTTTEVEIPASTYEETTYTCSDCGITFGNEEDAQIHYGEVHTVANTYKDSDGEIWRNFTSKDNFELFKKAYAKDMSGFFIQGEWNGPGWYGVVQESRPCPRSCCTDYYYIFTPVGSILKNISSEIQALQARYNEVDEISKR